MSGMWSSALCIHTCISKRRLDLGWSGYRRSIRKQQTPLSFEAAEIK
jgi:hypothetical protein